MSSRKNLHPSKIRVRKTALKYACCERGGAAAPDVVLTNAATVDQDFASLHVVKSLNEQDDGALAAAARPYKRHVLLRLDDEVEIV